MAMMISWVKPVNPSHPYLENDPAPSFDPPHLRISPWLQFRYSGSVEPLPREIVTNRPFGVHVARASFAWKGGRHGPECNKRANFVAWLSTCAEGH